VTDSQGNLLAGNFPKVSVIMPVRNEAEYIEKSLGSVLKQDYPADRMEVIIADGMSEDGTRDSVLKIIKDNGCFPVRVIDNPGLIVPTGLNAALKIAEGDIVIRVDGHTEIANDYISQCVSALNRTGAENVGGRMDAQGIGSFGQAVALATSNPFGIGGGRFHYSDKEEYVDTVYMGAWKKEVFEKFDILDEELVRNQDDEFNYRLLKNGCKILLCPQIKSKYVNRSSIKSLWRQYFQYGYWKVRVLQKHPLQMRLRQFVPATFVIALISSAFIAPFSESIRILLILIAGSYIAGNLLASGQIAWSKGWRHFPLLPIVFAVLHLSYGTGFLVGLVRFANRWREMAKS